MFDLFISHFLLKQSAKFKTKLYRRETVTILLYQLLIVHFPN